ncbi:hypothetical protein HMPREF0591_2960 [Mycobacterium parascrofulaceum ATCC BAA-614]|uniref:Predicted hydrolase N-terminal domain-containing protein n=1 Tax=Mycobacterium parascrofulaceum ATCC BAA-614 TaxID=525368 RepID=D5P9W6_9MYCO|nr:MULTISPECIES: hypothetical protein [Mycobacterium]EFG77147.1 hypothetical protein HMPREF0591_2960 [Mycobacterium parascrofulaceum ATCC BAA-614]OCB30962.1 hypothetical protein A9X02_26120 [Mycobacterium malmoense]
MQLRYISIAALIAEAGGDPWAINKSLQAGSPGQISSLAEVFHRAGRCTAEAQHAFEQARNRFNAAWNRRDGGHPINDSAEVQRVTQSLGLQSLQLPKIGVDLETIAASLAEAQKAAEGEIATLENQLQTLDGLIGQAVAMEQAGNLSAEDRHTLDTLIHNCESDAIDDTKAALAQLHSIRNGYSDGLRNSLSNLRTDGYDPASLHDVDADGSPKPTEAQLQALADLRRITDQAVVDQMGKVRAAQLALDKAMADLYSHGPGSPEGEAANASLPKLKADLAHALDDLGKIPDYKGIDPTSITTTPDGRFMFTYTVDGQPVQVYGQLKNGTGEFFDQAMGTSYTFTGGKLTGMRTPDPGKVEATPEPLWSAITLAVGGPELKAGGEAAWQGLKTLFSREALQGLSADNVLPRALSAAEMRAAIAEADLPPHGSPIPDVSGQPVPGAAHPGPPPVVEHAPHPGGGELPAEHAPAGPHVPVPPDGPPPVVIDPTHPEFILNNPLDYMTPELRALSEQHLTGSGETVLGPFKPPTGGPSYIDVAQQHGASYFDLGEAWNSLSPTERLAANQHVLDVAIANRDKITLSVPFYRVNPDTFTAAELRYLEAHGYRRMGDNSLLPPD